MKIWYFPAVLMTALLFLCAQHVALAEESSPLLSPLVDSAALNEVKGMGQTASWVDLDGDGWLDLVVSNINIKKRSTFVFRSSGDGTFKDITKVIGLDEQPYRTFAWADYNNDGLVDLLAGTIKGGAPPVLYENRGGRFSDVSTEVGIAHQGTVFHSFWVDYDRDGWADIFQVNTNGPVLYRNTGFGVFTEVTEEAGIREVSQSRSGVWLDYNNDSNPDLLVTNMGSNVLYKNNGDGTFTDVTESTKVGGHASWRTVAACAGDYDNDGNVDLYFVNIAGKTRDSSRSRNALFRNNGDGTFTDVTVATGTGDAGDGRTCNWVDFDNDGYLDLYASNHTHLSVLLHNDGKGSFANIAKQVGIDNPYDVFTAAWADYNHDGQLDVYLNGHIESRLYDGIGARSEFGLLVIRPRKSMLLPGSYVLGTRVNLRAPSGVQTRSVGDVGGAYNQDSLALYFGTGTAGKVDLEVLWPNGDKCMVEGLVIDNYEDYTILQDGCRLSPTS